MKAYQHILVATSLQEESDAVVDKATQIAKQSQAKLSIVHIMEFSPIMYGGGEFALPLDGDIEASLEKQARDGLARQAARVGIATADQYFEQGSAPENLAKLAKDLKVNLLIIGSHEHHGLGYLFGSTSNSVLHAMPCDILAVRV